MLEQTEDQSMRYGTIEYLELATSSTYRFLSMSARAQGGHEQSKLQNVVKL